MIHEGGAMNHTRFYFGQTSVRRNPGNTAEKAGQNRGIHWK